MTIRRKKKENAPESSASSDIAFLLIIYFIVIAGFNINKGFLLNLPAKDSTKLILKDDILRAELDADGTVYLGGEALSWAEAENEIRAALRVQPNLALVLSIEPLSHWQSVVQFVEMAKKVNVDSFSFSLKKDGT